MAKWHIFRRDNGQIKMTYTDLYTGRVVDCGETERSCPISMVVEWIVTQGNPAPGDWISVGETGQVLSISRTRGVA